jgi:hypothetical protein
MTTRPVRLRWAWCAAIYLSLSAASSISHDFWRDRVESEKRAGVYASVLEGEAKAPTQYRILIPALAAGLQELGLPFRLATVLLRFAFTALAAILLHCFLRRWFADEVCLVGTLLFFAYLPLTHIIYQMAWTDPANLCFSLLAFLAIAARRDGSLAVVLAVSMFNRETMLLIPLVWLLLRWDELPPLRCGALFAGYCAISFAIYFGLRDFYGAIPHAGAEFFAALGKTPLEHNLSLFRGYAYAAVWLAIPLWCACSGWSEKPKLMRRGLLFVPLFVVFHLFVAVFLEPRLLLPVFPLVLAPALAYFAPAREEAPVPVRTLPMLARSGAGLYWALLLLFVLTTHMIGYRLTHRALPFASG